MYIYIYIVHRRMYTYNPPGYHHSCFAGTHALGSMMYSYTLVPINQRVLNKLSKEHNISGHSRTSSHTAFVVITGRAHCSWANCFHDSLYIMLILLL